MSPKSIGAAFSPPFSLPLPSLSVLLPLSSVSSISRPLLYLPLASHCSALRKAQTASDKVRMIHLLLFAGCELWRDVELCDAQSLSFSLAEILALTLASALQQIFEWRREKVCITQTNTAECFFFFCMNTRRQTISPPLWSRVRHRNVSLLAIHQWSLQFISLQCKQRGWVHSVLWHSDFSTVTSVGFIWAAEVWYPCLRHLTPLVTAQSALFDLNLNNVTPWKPCQSCLVVVISNCSMLFSSDALFSGKFGECSSLPQFYYLVRSFMVYIILIQDIVYNNIQWLWMCFSPAWIVGTGSQSQVINLCF